MGRLDERVAVITGAGDGIGAGIARRFAEEGARVLVAEMNEAKGRATADELASTTGVRLVDVAATTRIPTDTNIHGLRPEETAKADTPLTRPF